MYLMFADESGDTGLINSPTKYFVLCALVVHELEWKNCLSDLVEFRRQLRIDFGLKVRQEIHAGALLTKPGELNVIPKHRRLEILRRFADKISTLRSISVISVVVNKQAKPSNYDVFDNAWRALIQRFENTIAHRNFPSSGNPQDAGLLSCDETDKKKLTMLIRKLRHHNPVPNNAWHGPGYRNLALKHLIEDPVFRDSAHSFLIQCADLCAHLLYQMCDPSSYMRRKSGQNYFTRLRPILCLKASSTDPLGLGIVRL